MFLLIGMKIVPYSIRKKRSGRYKRSSGLKDWHFDFGLILLHLLESFATIYETSFIVKLNILNIWLGNSTEIIMCSVILIFEI